MCDSSSGGHSSCLAIYLNVQITQGEPACPSSTGSRLNGHSEACLFCSTAQQSSQGFVSLSWLATVMDLGNKIFRKALHTIQGPWGYFLIPERTVDFFQADSCLHSGKKSQRTMDGTKCFGTLGSEWGLEVGERLQSQKLKVNQQAASKDQRSNQGVSSEGLGRRQSPDAGNGQEPGTPEEARQSPSEKAVHCLVLSHVGRFKTLPNILILSSRVMRGKDKLYPALDLGLGWAVKCVVGLFVFEIYF